MGLCDVTATGRKRGKKERQAVEQMMDEEKRKDDPDKAMFDDLAKGADGDWNAKGKAYSHGYDNIDWSK